MSLREKSLIFRPEKSMVALLAMVVLVGLGRNGRALLPITLWLWAERAYDRPAQRHD